MGEPKLRLQGVSQVYKGARGETRALQNMDIDVAPGEAVAILGPSGCGKSTSLLIAAGLRVPTQGAAFVDGVRVAGPRLNTALILQDFGLLPWKTVAENAGLGLQIRKTPKRERAERVARALEQVGLADSRGAFGRYASAFGHGARPYVRCRFAAHGRAPFCTRCAFARRNAGYVEAVLV